jgi:hypothetical protein
MLIIKNSQVEALNNVFEDELVRIIFEYIKDNEPEIKEGYPDFIMQQMIMRGIRYAAELEFQTELGYTTFVLFMLLTAPNFFEYDKVKLIFSKYKDDEQRFTMVNEVLTDQDWKNIQAFYNENYWN